MSLYQFLRSNKQSVFTLVYLLVAPFIFDSFLLSLAISKQELFYQLSMQEWTLFYSFCMVAMALGLTHTTVIALFSGYYLSWYCVPFVVSSYLIASLLGYYLGFLISGGQLIESIQKYPKAKAIKEELQKKEFSIILLSRLSPALPFAITNFLFAAFKTNVKSYFLAGAIGMLPRTLLFIWIGSEAQTLVEALKNPASLSYSRILTIVLLIISFAGLIYYINQALRKASTDR